jgi:hypothetical protein
MEWIRFEHGGDQLSVAGDAMAAAGGVNSSSCFSGDMRSPFDG